MRSKTVSSRKVSSVGLRRAAVDADARERLVTEHVPLVTRLCNRYRHSGVAMEDPVQIGIVGLVKAIDKFDAERGTAFQAFAVQVIVGEIRNYFRDHGWAVKIPRKLQRQRMAVEKAVERLTQSGGRSPTVPEITEETGYSQEEVYDTFEVSRYGSPLSLEAEYQHNGDGDSSTILESVGANDPQLDQIGDTMDLRDTMKSLSEREKVIILLKFYSGLSQTKIASRLGISQMHVSRLQRGALGKLKVGLRGTVG